FLPETFELNGTAQTTLRSRGIYEARLFQANNQISGQFKVPANWGITDELQSYRFDTPFIAVGISDIRGIQKGLNLTLNGETLAFEAGTGLGWLGGGVHVPLGNLDGKSEARLDYAFDLALQGTGQLHVVPVGRTSTVSLKANWPHPSFVGSYLPAEREITAEGFSAQWQASFFSTNLEDVLSECVNKDACDDFRGRTFGVSFVDP
ncbi:MAG: inner membrane CreD family protein, partial [Pseudomonas sp.]